MQKSTGTLKSQNLLLTNNRSRHQKTGSSRTGANTSSAQIFNGQKVTEKLKPKILDENNLDVTPKPLFEQDISVKNRHGSALFHSIEGASTPTDMISNASLLNTNAILTTAQSFGAFPESSTHISSDSNQIPLDSINDTLGINQNEKETSALFYVDIEKRSKLDSETKIIKLSETETFILLNFETLCLSDEDLNTQIIKEKNFKYIELCKIKIGNDSYADRGINTFNDAPKIKSTQTDRLMISEKGISCSSWDMYDSYNLEKTSLLNKFNLKTDSYDSSNINFDGKQKSLSSNTILSEINFKEGQLLSSMSNKKKENRQSYLEFETFKQNLFFMERFINLNTYQNKQARYRGLKAVSYLDENSKEQGYKAQIQQYDGPSLEKLWTYKCSLTKDRNVSCLVWNNKNKDILAAGYGKFEFNDEPSGLVCCWSLKNPDFPERYFKTDSGVTSLSFSQKHPNLLAVGLFTGNIIVFDLRNNNTMPLISTNDSENKHLSPVWNLKWIDKDRTNNDTEEMEVLMSISSDGRITQWMIRKGFESSDFLKLKKVNQGSSSNKDKEKSEGLISRHSGGLCFDIWDQDKSVYLCGTEDGLIHRCSTSYNEQYLDTYYGHTGPVYKITWSPFLKNCFLSCSADWSIRLWKMNRQIPCLNFNSSSKTIFDISWSNKSATLFCCVNENAIELWDINKNILDPIYSTSSFGPTKLTSISFSPNSDSLAAGSNDGNIYIYATKNLPPNATEKDLERTITQSLLSQLESIEREDEKTKDFIEINLQNSNNNDFVENSQINKFDVFEAKIDKIKNDNEAVLQGKIVHKKKEKKKNNKKHEDNISSSDEN